ncbi:DUF6177 family protein [Cellulomonas fimi]|uniref:DUF6177 family protein n=1 Tax=Cellulomonas fimi TaxID=1708 RepID=UPI00234CA5AD|nr:DUF6177 family protein [Cellulomonas fimi]MDC7121725.1 DUF6177 family protein [Cellulomonas fimi]
MTVPHPALDARAGEVLVTETRAEVAYLSETRADLLVRARADGRRVALVSDEVTRLSYPMREALRDSGGAWVVRGIDGTLRDGSDGRRLSSVGEIATRGPITAAEDVAVRFLRPVAPQSVQLVVSQAVRHRATVDTQLGGTAELFAEDLMGAAPSGWGAHEPAVVAWDRARLTELARNRMPEETTVVVAGTPERPLVGTIRTARTEHGLEETTQLVVGVGAPGSPQARAAIDALPGTFDRLATRSMPLFGLVMGRQGRRDLTFPSVLEAPPVPLAMLVGPPGVRDLGLPVDELVRTLGARVVGRPRVPGLYFPLGTLERDGWQAFDEVLRAIGHDRVREALGAPRGPWEGVLDGPRP